MTLPVHKSVICIQSPYFENAFKEKMVEGITGELKFEQGSGPAYWRVFEYLYTGNYSKELTTTGFQGKLTFTMCTVRYLTATR